MQGTKQVYVAFLLGRLPVRAYVQHTIEIFEYT